MKKELKEGSITSMLKRGNEIIREIGRDNWGLHEEEDMRTNRLRSNR